MHLFGVEIPDSLIPAILALLGYCGWQTLEISKLNSKVSEIRAKYEEQIGNLKKRIGVLEEPRSRNRRDRRDDG